MNDQSKEGRNPSPSPLEKYFQHYNEKNLLPLHMPGHQRKAEMGTALPYAYDYTEVEDLDNLHTPEGILQEAMNRTAAYYGCSYCFYLVNGSSSGLQAGIFTLLEEGDEVVVARNCHRSVFYALSLRKAKIHFLLPEFWEDFSCFGSISPKEVERLLGEFPKSKALIFTSPSYEGVVSDVEGIARLCHENGLSLLVDEAHGAHFSPKKGASFPESAIALGADLVVQSPHKTLCSLTQSAWILGNGQRYSREKLSFYLSVFQTTSPSYPLMLSLEKATTLLEREGEALFSHWKEVMRGFREKTRTLSYFTFLWEKEEACFAMDFTKIFLRARGIPKLRLGKDLAKLLREDYGIESEMHSGENLLLMTGPFISEEELDRLFIALKDIERRFGEEKGKPLRSKLLSSALYQISIADNTLQISEGLKEGEELNLRDGEGRICLEYLSLYPPGIPLLFPGEKLTAEKIQGIEALEKEGIELQYSRHRQGERGKLIFQKDKGNM
ncbi:arginine/lysine/ornithine decarboxylase [Oribacterium sinus]|uniref:Arginine/lysine/ornithine decarboxylase n=1 Tax=Oribacterium sinus TaxID=237576 RepID=A0A7W9W2F7_9FIRM|nr:aminotransferase class I/II-fold pyridoxal phosphate-dependent enzyme [Oribacterium sinus]MBB6041207.1 arginine/lysine/ornithine decarboxylase [Oribacterium sinus]